jgi:hypothetical protein
MPEFRTPMPMPESFPMIGYKSRILSVGSCFAETIGEKLKRAKLDIVLNPSGIVYNPLVLGQLLERLQHRRAYQEEELFLHNGLWHSFAHHSRFSGPLKDNCLLEMNTAFEQASYQLEHATHLMITLGTAFVYEWNDTGLPVSNCHKIPAARFTRRLAGVDEMLKQWKPQLQSLFNDNKKLELIMTVSPVRHLKEGLHQNNLSKAALLLLVEALCHEFPKVHYFPAYEIVTDELRDYRFYDKDMAHPSEVAVEYIWKQFTNLSMKQKTLDMMRAVLKIKRALAHRPFQQASSGHQAFLLKQLAKIKALQQEIPFLDWSEEEQLLRSQMLN